MFNTCIIKNLSISNESVLGVLLAQDETYTIPDSKRISAANDSSILDRISSGVLQVGNGSSFFTTTASQINYLTSVVSQVSISEVSSDTLSSSFNSSLRVEMSNTEVNLNPVSSGYNTIYSYSGSGKLIAFSMDFDSDKVYSKLVIDGDTIYDIDCDVLESGTDEDDESSHGANSPFGSISWNRSKNRISFHPKIPIIFNSSVSIQAKASSSSTSKDMEFYIVEIVKD